MNHIRIPDWQSKRRRFVSRGARVCIEGSDTLYYQGDLLDLNNYYLRGEIPVYEDGTQKYLFRLDVVHSDFN